MEFRNAFKWMDASTQDTRQRGRCFLRAHSTHNASFGWLAIPDGAVGGPHPNSGLRKEVSQKKYAK